MKRIYSILKLLLISTLLLAAAFISQSCEKEFSCEGCQQCVFDTTISMKDTAWRFNIGNKLFYGSQDFSAVSPNRQVIDFYGYSLHSPGAILTFEFSIAPLTFDQNHHDIAISDILTNYGTASGYVAPPEGAYVNNPNGLNGIIKKFDTSTKTLEGYFCGTVLDTLKKSMKITNGRFKIKID